MSENKFPYRVTSLRIIDRNADGSFRAEDSHGFACHGDSTTSAPSNIGDCKLLEAKIGPDGFIIEAKPLSA